MALTKLIFSSMDANSPINIVGDVLRERGADTVVYALSGHTPQNPYTMTVTSQLPVPRKGNAGTTKTLVVIRRDVTINQGTDQEKNVPVIARLETSFPVGTNFGEIGPVLEQIGCAALLEDNKAMDFYMSGLPLELQ